MYKYIKHVEDIERANMGAYSPGLRDHAQEAQNMLFNFLNAIPGKESFLALLEIAKKHPQKTSRPWMIYHAQKKAELDGNIKPWSASHVREFHEQFERTPGNHKELAELAIFRLLDLKDDFEHGDSSIANTLQNVAEETEMRTFIGRELREKASGRYSISQEEELADAKRPDLRFHGVGFDGPVPVELKLADNWSGPELLERLENQLCGDYLRDNHSKRGIFLLVNRKSTKHWVLPENNNKINFDSLVESLQKHWLHISQNFPKIEVITVIGIDLSKRSPSRKKRKPKPEKAKPSQQ
jgi:hypothetical protein